MSVLLPVFVSVRGICGNREVCSSGQEPVFLHLRKMAITREERRLCIMPVLESTEFTTPRSALRHRPIGNDGKHQEKRSTGTDVPTPTPIVPRASRTRSTDTDVEIDEWERAEGKGEKSR